MKRNIEHVLRIEFNYGAYDGIDIHSESHNRNGKFESGIIITYRKFELKGKCTIPNIIYVHISHTQMYAQ